METTEVRVQEFFPAQHFAEECLADRDISFYKVYVNCTH